MDFIDKIRNLANRIPAQLEYCQTEEATKTALIMPFINALGYDVFDPAEVVPEFIADIGTKKGEKADYAIIIDGKPLILLECKWSGSDLGKEHASQLHRYFTSVPSVKFGVLTNGIHYQFFSDLDAPNRMDTTPFFEFNVLDIQERQVNELKKFTKSSFDLDEIITTASELKYTAAIIKIAARDFESPSEDFVRYFTGQVYSGIKNQRVIEQFTEITRKALRRYLTDQINERLQSAIQDPDATPQPITSEIEPEPEEIEDESVEKKEIITTKDEIEGFFAIKSILRETIDIKRVTMRDKKTLCGILLDDNNRKPICRLYFNTSQWYIGLVDENKAEERIPINEIDEIYNYADRIIAITNRHDS